MTDREEIEEEKEALNNISTFLHYINTQKWTNLKTFWKKFYTPDLIGQVESQVKSSFIVTLFDHCAINNDIQQ